MNLVLQGQGRARAQGQEYNRMILMQNRIRRKPKQNRTSMIQVCM